MKHLYHFLPLFEENALSLPSDLLLFFDDCDDSVSSSESCRKFWVMICKITLMQNPAQQNNVKQQCKDKTVTTKTSLHDPLNNRRRSYKLPITNIIRKHIRGIVIIFYDNQRSSLCLTKLYLILFFSLFLLVFCFLCFNLPLLPI